MQPVLSLCAAAIIAAITGCSSRQEPDTVAPPPPSPTHALAANPLASFERMIGGRWKKTALAGTNTFDTWHWGPGNHSIRKMTEGLAPTGEPWHGITVIYWHPGRREVRSLGVSPFARGVSEGTILFDREEASGVFDVHQTIGLREFALRWTFDGPDRYHDQLLDRVPGDGDGLSLQNEWDRVRVAAADEGERAATRTRTMAATPTAFLKPLERLLGHDWDGTPDSAAAPTSAARPLGTRTTFEYVPYADAIYGRVQALIADGTLEHTVDIYLYHHTGAQVLRCLALASDAAGEGIVYEGDITPVDEGRSLVMDLKEHRSGGVSTLEVRLEFKPDGTIHQRTSSIIGEKRAILFELHHRAMGK